MTDTEDICPVTDNGNHRYFIFKVVEVFEHVPYDMVYDANGHIHDKDLYEKVEYAISGCNCGSSIKQEVKQQ